jgi:putative DNA-invertase from lambdoid prophage Rac
MDHFRGGIPTQKAGISAAKGDERKYLGRKPRYSQETLSLVTDLLSQGSGTSEVARSAGLSRQAVLRIKADPAAAQEALPRWQGVNINVQPYNQQR